jgi:hypothetical protein
MQYYLFVETISLFFLKNKYSKYNSVISNKDDLLNEPFDH